MSLESKANFELLKAERKREGGRGLKKKKKRGGGVGGGEKSMIHSTQEAFSHSTSCITHEVLTEPRAHSPFPLAVSGWQPAQAGMNKMFRPFLSVLLSLFPSFRLSPGRGTVSPPPPHPLRIEVTVMETGCCWRRRQVGPGCGCVGQPTSRAAPLVALEVCSVPASSRAAHYSGPCA